MTAEGRTLDQLGPAIKAMRDLRGASRRVVANMVGCKESDILDWEEGRSFPTARQFARLRNMMDRSLNVFRPALEVWWRAQSEARILEASAEEAAEASESLGGSISQTMGRALADAVAQLPGPPPQTPAPLPAGTPAAGGQVSEPAWLGDPWQADTFGEALRRARFASGLSQNETGELVGVGGATVSRWERCEFMPVRAIYHQLLGLFPVLMECVPGNGGRISMSQDRRRSGRRPVELKGIALEAAPRARRVDPAIEGAGAAYARALAAQAVAARAAQAAKEAVDRAEEDGRLLIEEAGRAASALMERARVAEREAASRAAEADAAAAAALQELQAAARGGQ